MAYADFLGIERLDHWRGKFCQPNSGGLCCQFAYVEMGAFLFVIIERKRIALLHNILRSFAPDHQRELSPALLRTISEAAIWCSQRDLLGISLRSPELDPFAMLDIPDWSHDLESFEAWREKHRDSYCRAIAWINQTRSELLKAAALAVLETVNPLAQNKLLLYFPLETVHDGAAEAASRGFYDIEDAPPWDTWFLYENDAVFCCVPEPAISAAQAGIDANPVDCIHWANWSELSRVGK